MSQLSIKSGDRLTVDGIDGDIVLQFDRICGGYAHLKVEPLEDITVRRGKVRSIRRDVPNDLKDITDEIISLFSEMDAASSQIMLAQFVSDLFLGVAQKRQSEERRQKQAEGIAEAKARGVKFGREPKPLPDNFDECYEAWQDGQMTATQAAEACGLSRKGFYRAIERKKKMIGCAV